MSGLSNDKKWEVYATYLSSTWFCTGEQPDPACLELLLQDLGVTLEQVERLIEGETIGEAPPEGQPGERPGTGAQEAG
ncbi:MAG: hypothetical protein HYS12_02530 [Planctomycetes bacterium]|nr:hypothetical protein [Planctomycetota bacterium]